MPTELQGEYGSCGHKVTNTDELINAMAISINFLNDKIKLLEEKLK